ncbi:MAG: hypothetical protein LAT61_04730 [Alcanivorax sp.]|nr:hypothetical protein [Alcanivorax sp.]
MRILQGIGTSRGGLAVALFLVLLPLYVGLAYLSRGGDVWWHIDFVSGGNVLWGDDAYRYYLASLAFSSSDIYFFSFALPLAVFMDGVLVALFHDQYPIRVVKAALLAGSAVLSYLSCCRVTSRKYALVCCLAVYTFPLYIFVGISFYGEAWFIILFSLALFLYFKERILWAALVISILPLFRIEGLFVLIAFSVVVILRHDVKSFLLLYTPGGIYFVFIMLMGPGLVEFISWRSPMNDVYDAADVWYQFSGARFLGTMNLFLFVPFVIGFMILARHRWVMLSVLAIVSFFSILPYLGKASFEPRYLVMAMPALPIGLAAFIQYIKGEGAHWLVKPVSSYVTFFVFLSIFIFNAKSVHVVDDFVSHVLSHGSIPEEVKKQPLAMSTYFVGMPREEIESYQELSGAIQAAIKEHKEIKTLIVSNFLVYYFLDLSSVPDDVMPVFAIFGRGRLDPILGPSLSAGYFHRPPYFSYFSLSYPYHGDDLILYVDHLPIEGYPLRWSVAGHHIAIVAGEKLTADQVENWRMRPFVGM